MKYRCRNALSNAVAVKEQNFPWSSVDLVGFKNLKDTCPEVFALSYRLNVLSDAFDRYTLELDTREKVKGKTTQLSDLLDEVNSLFTTLSN